MAAAGPPDRRRPAAQRGAASTRRCASSIPRRDPARYAALLARQARITWSLNRGEEAVETAERALAMLPEDDPGGERPLLLAWLARTRFLRGRFRDAVSEGEAALEVAVAAGDHERRDGAAQHAGDGLRVARRGREGDRVAASARSSWRARNDDFDSLATAYSNLADMLGRAGRTDEALRDRARGAGRHPDAITCAATPG